MRFPQARPWTLIAILCAPALSCGVPSNAHAQGDLEKTPWATGMVYPVGDPKDFQLPAPGETRGYSISRGLLAGRRRHEGVDLSNRGQGGQVRAIAPGLVVCTRTDHGSGWGNMVVLAHRLPGGEVLFSLFAHLMPGSIAVREGEVVALGQQVGRIGSTGRATGPHLHLEFRTLGGSLQELAKPLARAWETASVIDPLRIFPTMVGGRANEVPPTISAPAPMVALSSGAAFAPSATARPDGALTRGELYRFALARIEFPVTDLPKRWNDVRRRLSSHAGRLPQFARSAFAADVLPRREVDAKGPAGLSEVVTVFTALSRTMSQGAGAHGTVVAASRTDRDDLESVFPHALVALEPGANVIPAPAWRSDPVGPPAVSRRQAAALWDYLEGSSLAARGPSAAASAASLP